MGTKVINRMRVSRIVMLNILLFSSLLAEANFGGKLKNTLSKEFNSLTGIYIMGGLIAVGLLIYILSNYVFKEKEDKTPHDGTAHHTHHHHRHKHRHPHKKV